MRRDLLIPSGAKPGLYGDASNSAQVTVDAQGRVTKVANVGITSGAGGAIINQGVFAARPAASHAGDLYVASDSLILSRDTGAAWQHFAALLGPLTQPPAVSSFTWVNQGSSTATDTGGGIVVVTPISTGSSIRILKKAAPSTPYTVTAAFVPPVCLSTSSSEAFRTGLGWRTSDSKITYVALGSDGGVIRLNIYTATTETSGFTSVATSGLLGFGHLAWLRIEDDATNRKVYLSNDGLNWVLIYTVARTTFHTPTEVGLFFDSNHASFNNISTYYHYKEA